MASYYVWSGATGSANGTSWANAYTTLTAAFTGHAAGDTYYVAHDHAETPAAGTNIALASLGTVTAPTKIVCVNRAGSVPPVSADRRATATVTTTTFGGITFTGFSHYDGIIFNCGTAVNAVTIVLANAAGVSLRFDNCSLRLVNTAAGAKIQMLASGTYVELNNTTMSFGNTNQCVQISAVMKWRNTPSALLGTIPTQLFQVLSTDGGEVECLGVDFSAAGSGKTLCSAVGTSNAVKFNFVDCKLDAAVTKSAVPLAHGASEVDFIRSGSAGVNYTIFRHRLTGTLDHETTIVRTGGASDGTTAIAWKVITTANCNYSLSFECPPIAIWNDTVGSAVTATVEGIWGGGAVPNDDDIWIDVEYLGDASSPQGSFVNDGKADLLTAAAGQASSSATWGGSTTAFKLAVTFTAQQKGWVYARVKCAKASSTFYIDPMVTLS